MENTMVDVIIETIDEVRAEFVKWVKEEDATKKVQRYNCKSLINLKI